MGATPSSPVQYPLAIDQPEAIGELREVLRAAGYTGQRVQSALGSEGPTLSRAIDVPLHTRRLAGIGPLGAMLELFVLGLPVSRGQAKHAFAPLSLERLAALGLLKVEGEDVRALVRIVPHDEILIVSDRRGDGENETRPDHVAGVHTPSVTLAHLTVRRAVDTALEVGTGCGIQAILIAAHSERVVATDLNERALNFAAFNAQLNGVTNVEFRAGSFFEPVVGDRFDLIVSNPPYVISPESEYLFRDAGLPGDSVSRNVVRQMPGALEEGGFATILVSWVRPPSEDWSAPLRSWIEGSGCDAWLLHYKTEDPLTDAANWNRDQFAHDPQAFGDALDRWGEYFERLGIEAIAYGAIVLRRRTAERNWVRADELPAGRLGPASDHIQRVFAAEDFLAELPNDDALLDRRLVPAARTTMEQERSFRDGVWVTGTIVLTIDEGLGFRADVDQHTARLLAGLDGKRTLGEVVDAFVEAAGPDVASRDVVVEGALPVIRAMLSLGFLIPIAS